MFPNSFRYQRFYPNDQQAKMTDMALTLFVVWLYTRFIKVILLPLTVVNYFKKPITCSPIKNPVLLLPGCVLAEQIRKKELSSERLVKAYIERIIEVNPLINAVVEERFNEALEEARNIDKTILTKYTYDEIKEKWPLLGVPITIKSSIAVAGLTHSSGCANRKIIANTDAVAVKLVKDAGAIPLLTSNVPELCLNWETTNKLIGTTRNPYKSTRTVGGSSGGEAGLLCAGASPWGIGSDIAGSLRLPAHFCGVFGHKPSPCVVSCEGHYPDSDNLNEWSSIFTLGPLARFAGDLRLLLDIISEPSAKKNLNLNEKINLRNIKIFYMDDNRSKLTDRVNCEIVDILQDVVKFLNTQCLNECKRVDIPAMCYAAELSYIKLMDSNVNGIFDKQDENVYLELLRLIIGLSKSEFPTVLVGLILRNKHLLPEKLKNHTYKEIANLKETFLEMLDKNGVFICPTSPTEAHNHGEIYKRVFNNGYVSIFNSLGLPATHCPIGFTRNGLPIGIQIVAAPNCDNLTLTVAEELEKYFGGWKPITESHNKI